MLQLKCNISLFILEYIKIINFDWIKGEINMLKNKEELIKQNIQEVINSWDPIGLMNICPEDEYEPEINEIVEFVICNKNINKILLSEEIRKIFNFYFTSIYNSINEVEEDVASKILEKCKNIL